VHNGLELPPFPTHINTSPPPPAGGASPSIEQMLAVASDQLAEHLDAAKGSSVSDHSIFRAHAAKYEVRQVAVSLA
jgi:hypothetical protein